MCCESIEAMAQIIDIAKIGWTKEQIMEWLQKEECEIHEQYSEVPQGDSITNADRIRSMSDEELLDFICSIETYDDGSVKTIEGGCALCSVTDVENWLQSELEE